MNFSQLTQTLHSYASTLCNPPPITYEQILHDVGYKAVHTANTHSIQTTDAVVNRSRFNRSHLGRHHHSLLDATTIMVQINLDSLCPICMTVFGSRLIIVLPSAGVHIHGVGIKFQAQDAVRAALPKWQLWIELVLNLEFLSQLVGIILCDSHI
ncbi:unnamed protein product [Ceratitis capitata]|uniref:(Mediterranean fruit fly) hypothetical protein n=1 Tax=Ceratitis capitata TaxID=7213 RepID=A0A811U682_CERCA|nr:unnamed protein product [Ceratitis capitata]